MTPDEINAQLDTILKECSSNTLPTLCKRMSNPNGYLFVKNRLIHLVTHNQLGIDTALAQIESELNEMV